MIFSIPFDRQGMCHQNSFNQRRRNTVLGWGGGGGVGGGGGGGGAGGRGVDDL